MKKIFFAFFSLGIVALAGCMVGPTYKRPSAPVAPAFKEAPMATPVAADGWEPGHPADTQLKGDWWKMFDDTRLNHLEAQVDSADQTLKEAAANFRAARAQIGYTRSYESPTLNVGSSIAALRQSTNRPYAATSSQTGSSGDFTLPLDLNYEIDLWGSIRRGVAAAREQTEAADADLESVRLSLHAELALDYFGLRTADTQIQLLQNTVAAYRQALHLTQDRYDGGIAPQSDVSQAQTQLDEAQVQLTDLHVRRAQYEHAISVLIGKPPAKLSLPAMPLNVNGPTLPKIPGMVPATLLQRRPDIAAAERRMAAANEEIGIAEAAYFPTLSLNASAGFEGTSVLNWLNWPSRFWAVGPAMAETIFDAGRRRATKQMTEADYDATVANYRQTVLTAFQQVEDNLAALRVLKTEANQQHEATASAQQTLSLFKARYEGGVDTYLQVVTWQTAALQNEENDLIIMQRRLDASVLLIKALGGGWSTSMMHD